MVVNALALAGDDSFPAQALGAFVYRCRFAPVIRVSPFTLSASIRFQPSLTRFSIDFSVGKAYVDAVNRGKRLNLTALRYPELENAVS